MTLAAGVPTVWQGLLTHVEANALTFSTVRRTIIGNAACPPDLMRAFQERYDIQVLHACDEPGRHGVLARAQARANDMIGRKIARDNGHALGEGSR